MNFDIGLFSDYWSDFADGLNINAKYFTQNISESKYDSSNIVKNNLSSIAEFIEFFTMLLYFISNSKTDMVEECFRKLDYLGFSSTGRIEMTSNEIPDILNSMVQAAYLLYEDDNQMNDMIYKHFLDKVSGLMGGK